jgi:hypothetical protein
MTLRWMKLAVALSAYGVLAAPVPSSDIGSCTVTELDPADPQAFCEDRFLVLDELSKTCGLPRVPDEERSCENFHFPPGCVPSARNADHCLDVLYALDSDECGNATDVRDIDVSACGPCPGRP